MASIVGGVLMARWLGPAAYGRLQASRAWVMLFVFLAEWGLDRVVVQQASADRDRVDDWAGQLLFWRLVMGLIAAGGCCVVGWIVRPGDALVPLLSVFLVGKGLLGAVLARCQLSGAFGRMAVVAALDRAGYLVLVVALLWPGHWQQSTAARAAWSIVLAPLVATALGLAWAARPRQWRFRLSRVQAFLDAVHRPAAFLMLAGLVATPLQKIDVLMIEHWHGDDAVGMYGLALTALGWLFIATESLHSVLLPISSQRQSRRYFARLLRRTLVLVAAAAVFALLVWPTAEWAIGLVLPQYVGAAGPLRVLVWVFPLALACVWCIQVYDSTGNQWLNLVNGIVMTAVNVAMCWWLIPSRGVGGAAVSLVGAFAAAVVVGLPSAAVVLRTLSEDAAPGPE